MTSSRILAVMNKLINAKFTAQRIRTMFIFLECWVVLGSIPLSTSLLKTSYFKYRESPKSVIACNQLLQSIPYVLSWLPVHDEICASLYLKGYINFFFRDCRMVLDNTTFASLLTYSCWYTGNPSHNISHDFFKIESIHPDVKIKGFPVLWMICSK